MGTPDNSNNQNDVAAILAAVEALDEKLGKLGIHTIVDLRNNAHLLEELIRQTNGVVHQLLVLLRNNTNDRMHGYHE